MSTPSRIILCLDPGLTSGVAQINLYGETPTLVTSAELGVDETEEWLARHTRMDGHAPGFEMVAETFIITVETAKKSQSPWSLRLLGSAHYIWRTHSGPTSTWTEQKPSEAKRLVTNDILKHAGLWHRGGEGHANDAIRHGVYRLITTGWSGKDILPV
jgi:hypothetical protein